MNFQKVTKVDGLTVQEVVLIENPLARMYGLVAHPAGKWGLFLATQADGGKVTLVTNPGVAGALEQGGVVPSLDTVKGAVQAGSIHFVADGWPSQWLMELGSSRPNVVLPKIGVSAQTKLLKSAARYRDDRIQVTVTTTVNAPGDSLDQTGLSTHYEVRRSQLPVFMMGVNAVARTWVPEGTPKPNFDVR